MLVVFAAGPLRTAVGDPVDLLSAAGFCDLAAVGV